MKHAGILIIVGVAIVTFGCIGTKKQVEVESIRYFETSGNTGLVEEIAAIEGSVNFNSREGAEKVLRLAVLTSLVGGRPDYKKALEMINRYRAVVPKNERPDFTDYIYSLLAVIVKDKKQLKRGSIALTKEMNRAMVILKKNRALENKIIDLKNLEIRLEKQRLGAE